VTINIKLPWKRSFRVLIVFTALASGCSFNATEKPKEENAAGRRVLLRNMGERVFLTSITNFGVQAAALSQITKSYAASGSDKDRTAAQQAWIRAMAAWQRVEMLQVGPARNIGSAPGGQGLRQEIYSWPDTNACGIDRALVDQTYTDEAKLLKSTFPNVRGLDALEMLLFAASEVSACPANNSIISSGEWAALAAGDLTKRRAAYASALGTLVEKDAKKLESAWKNAFLEQLKSAGDGSKLFSSTQDALNAISDAIFYLDGEVKDMKLANPLGISMVCTGKRCPAEAEHALAKVSKESILVNLETFRDAFRGLPPSGKRGDEMWGFKDLLLSVSADDVASDMDRLIDKAIASVEAIDGSLETALLEDGQQAAQADKAYMAVQELSALLRTQFVAKLALKLPMSAAGDND
jgi:uncharacterized protein